MSTQYHRSDVHVLSTNARETRYVFPNTVGDSQPVIRVRTNDPLSQDITGEVTIAYLSPREIIVTFPSPPGNQTFLVDLTAHEGVVTD